MKAVSAVIATVMLLMVTVSLVGVSYVFSSTITTTTTSSGSEQAAQLTGQLSSCMRIENINGNKVELRNCGKGIIENRSLVVTMDEIKLGSSVQTISEDSSGTVNVSGLWQIAPGKHNLKISNGATFALALVDVQVNKDGLVGSWSFDEGSGIYAGDGSGNGNSGTMKNATAATCGSNGACPDWVDGKFRKALRFDGIGDYVNVPNNPTLNPTSEITISAWTKASGYTPTGFSYTGLLRKESQYLLTFDNGGAKVYRTYVNLGGWNATANSGTPVQLNEWHLVTGTYDGSNIRIFIDGLLKNTNTRPIFPIGTSTNNLNIGTAGWGNPVNGYFFNGIIDEVRIWNKALSPDETVMMKQII